MVNAALRRHCRLLATAGFVGLMLTVGVPPADAAVRLPPLTGRLHFGTMPTRFRSLVNRPELVAIPDPAGNGFLTDFAVAAGEGELPGWPGLSFGDGQPRRVRVRPDGDAEYLDPAVVAVQGSGEGSQRVAGIRFGYGRLQLSVAGLAAFDAYVGLPAGCGFGHAAGSRLLHGRLPLGLVAVGPDLQPGPADFELRAVDLGVAALYFHSAALPLVLVTDRIVWRVVDGAFEVTDGRWEYVRAEETDFLEEKDRALLLPVETRERAANDAWLRAAHGLDGRPVRVRVDGKGRSRIDAVVTAGAGEFRPHFPGNTVIPIADARLEMQDGAFVDEVSRVRLMAGAPLRLGYDEGCPDRSCGAGARAGVLFEPVDGELRVSPDGGLAAAGAVADEAGDPVTLAWGALGSGRYAHSVGAFTDGSFLSAGFVAHSEAALEHLAAPDRAAAMLLSGHGGSGGVPILERPRTDAYAEGAADYPGVNLRVEADRAAGAVSVVAGRRLPATGTYPVLGSSKYYARAGGVSGRHQAVLGGMARDLVLYGFPVVLEEFRLSFLGNDVEQSATGGAFDVPFPSGFRQEFKDLRLRCSGQLRDARIGGDARHLLAYWLAPFQALTLEFREMPGQACDSTNGVLVVGAAVGLPLVKKPISAALGFRPDGRLVTEADGIPGVDSRLDLPAVLSFEGPEGRPYHLQPVVRGYFNDWPGSGKEPADGFVSLAGKLDLPWFLDAKVHLHAVGGGLVPWLQVMGGWNSDARPDDPVRAWLDPAGHSFFDRQDFDAAHRGYPPGVTVDTYRDSGTDRFRPRARQRLFGLAGEGLDFPLAWEAASRSFTSAGAQRADLLVFQLEGEASRITARDAQVRFSASVRERLPDFSASEFLLGQLEKRAGLFGAVSNAVWRTLTNNAAATRLREGSDALDRLVNPNLDRLLGGELLAALNAPVDALLDDLLARAASGTVGGTNFHEAFCAELALAANPLKDFQSEFLAGTGLVDVMARQIVNSLATAEDGVSSAIDIVALKPVAPVGFERRVVSEIVKRGIREAPPDAPPLVLALAQNVAADTLDRLVDQYVSENLEPALAELERTLRRIDGELLALKRDLEAGRGALDDGVRQAQAAFSAANTFYGEIQNALCADLAPITQSVAGALTDRVRLRERIKRVLLSKLLEGVLPRETHLVLRQYLLAHRALFRGALEDLFARVNDTLVGVALGPARSWVAEQLPALDRSTVAALDRLRGVVEGSRLYGSADIEGEELRRLRVDGEFRFGFGPTELGPDAALSLNAWYAIENQRGDGPGRGCLSAGGSALVVAFGAATTPREGFAEGLRLGVTGRFAVDPTQPGLRGVLGVSGGLEMSGAKRVGGFTMQDPYLGFSFGDEGTYVGGTVAGRFKTFSVTGRMFHGTACRLDQLELVDAQTTGLLAGYGIGPADRLAGYYLTGDLYIPLEKLLPTPLPSTCLLHVEARGGTGQFAFAGRKPGAPPGFFLGLRQRFGLQGELLCVLSGEGDLELVGAVGADLAGTPQSLVTGELRLSGRVGLCPLCEKVTKKFPWRARMTVGDVEFLNPF